MAVMRVRVADTEAIAKFYPMYKGVRLHKIVTLNYNGKGRRQIKLDVENQKKLEEIIYDCLQEKLAIIKSRAAVVVAEAQPCLTI